jgi:hypothetical protein
LYTDQDKISTIYRGLSIDASYQVSVHLAKRFQRRRFKCGQGVDRHLLGLKLAAIKNGMNVPSLHMDTTYSTSVHFKVSTSQVSIRIIPFLF